MELKKKYTEIIVDENFRKFKFISILSFFYSIIIIITDFGPLEIWKPELLLIYRAIDIAFAAVSILAVWFYWFNKHDNNRIKDKVTKAIYLFLLLWAAIISAIDYSALGFSTLILVMLGVVFFIYIDYKTLLVYFSIIIAEFTVLLLLFKEKDKNLNRVLITFILICIIVFFLSKKNYSNKIKELVQKLKMGRLNKDLSGKTEKLEAALKTLNEKQVQLIHSERMAALGGLTASVAHEVNNPLNFIKSGIIGLKVNMKHLIGIISLYSGLDEDNYKRVYQNIRKKEVELNEITKMLEKSLDIIEKGVDRAARISKTLDSYVRPNENDLVPVDLNKSLDICISLLQSNISQKIDIRKNYAKIPKILCHPGDINQVVMNLLLNAIEFIEVDGEILIETKIIENDWVQVSIKDNGIGIEPSSIHKIFEPFFTTKDVGKGIGLGLTISYNIVKEHGGEIHVESEAGKGTVFTLKLPIKK